MLNPIQYILQYRSTFTLVNYIPGSEKERKKKVQVIVNGKWVGGWRNKPVYTTQSVKWCLHSLNPYSKFPQETHTGQYMEAEDGPPPLPAARPKFCTT